MILKALADYYERLINDESINVPPYGFEDKPIPFLIVLDNQGIVQNIIDTRTGEGRKKLARTFRLPQGEKKASGIKENLLWDNPQYVLGEPKSEKPKDVKKAKGALAAFKQRLAKDLNELKDEGVLALFGFYQNDGISQVRNHAMLQEVIDGNANITFMLDGESGLIAQRPKIVQRIKDL